jgi:adenylyl-sulfate kinase
MQNTDSSWSSRKVHVREREVRNQHRGLAIWLTGLSASGKSTLANQLERQLFDMGKNVCLLDGDCLRQGLCADLGFSPEDRKENIRRIGEVALLLANLGCICITALISPYRSDRKWVRNRFLEGRFIEVFVNAPLEICEARDPKGLYLRARANRIKNFTGISAPYQPPLSPELEIPTHKLSISDSVAMLLDCVLSRSGTLK